MNIVLGHLSDRLRARCVRRRRIRCVLPDPGSPYKSTEVLLRRCAVVSIASRHVWNALRPISETSPSSLSQGSPTIQFENGLVKVTPQGDSDVVGPCSVEDEVPALGIAQPQWMVVPVKINASIFVKGQNGLIEFGFRLPFLRSERSPYFYQRKASWFSFQLVENAVFKIRCR